MVKTPIVFDEFKYVGDALGIERHVIKDIENIITKLDRVSRLKSWKQKALNVFAPSTIRASVSNKNKLPDLLLANFWNTFWGIIRNVNVDAIVVYGGATYTLRTAGDFARDTASIHVGDGTDPEKFDDYKLSSDIKSFKADVSLGYDSSKSRVTASAVTDVDVQEVGITEEVYDDAGNNRTALITRKVISYSAGSTICVYIDFMKPWLYNIAKVWHGILANLNVDGVVDEAGNSFTVRSSGDLNSSGAVVMLSPSTVSWEPTLHSIPDALKPDQYVHMHLARKYSMLIYDVYRAPSTDEEWQTIGLKMGLFDTDGNSHDTYIAVLPLDTPITFKSLITNLLQIRLVAL